MSEVNGIKLNIKPEAKDYMERKSIESMVVRMVKSGGG